MKPERICESLACECLASHYNLDNLEIVERQIIRKLFGPRKISEVGN